MRNIKELKNKMKEKEELYNNIEKEKDEFDLEAEGNMVIARIWIETIEDLLDHNVAEFMEKNGYEDKDIETTFSVNDENVQKEIVATEEQIIEMLDFKMKLCERFPYGRIDNMGYKGIWGDKLEVDILKWVLEKE